jgi:hypothetical protein
VAVSGIPSPRPHNLIDPPLPPSQPHTHTHSSQKNPSGSHRRLLLPITFRFHSRGPRRRHGRRLPPRGHSLPLHPAPKLALAPAPFPARQRPTPPPPQDPSPLHSPRPPPPSRSSRRAEAGEAWRAPGRRRAEAGEAWRAPGRRRAQEVRARLPRGAQAARARAPPGRSAARRGIGGRAARGGAGRLGRARRRVGLLLALLLASILRVQRAGSQGRVHGDSRLEGG